MNNPAKSLRIRFRENITVKLALGITLIVVTVMGLGLYKISGHHFRTRLKAWQESAETQNRLMRLALEHQMVENDRRLIRKMVESFARDNKVSLVMILDHQGRVKFSSEPQLIDQKIERTSDTCKTCHLEKPEDRSKFMILDSDRQKVLRSVEPIENKETCHKCHDPEEKINGILILDVPVQQVEREIKHDILWMTVGTGIMAVMVIIGIGILMRLLVFNRLSHMISMTRVIAQGDLKKRVKETGNDQISELAREFNYMAESVEKLLNDVLNQQKRLENIMNSVDEGLIVLDRNLEIVAMNESFIRRAGIPRKNLKNRYCPEIIAAKLNCHKDKHNCPSLRCFESGNVEKTTLYYLDANGEDKIEEVYASPIFDEQGKVEQVVEVWRDITERRKEEARLAELHRLASVGMLASGFSHEVNTPLSTMLTCIDSTLSKFKGDNSISDGESKEIIEDAEVIREEILRCKKITGQFLKFSAGQNLTLDLVNVEQAIDVVVKLIGSTARAQGISVKKVVPEKLPAVLANEGALEQVLLNLLLNAIQASRSGDQVMIKCEVDMNELNLIIEDNGKGIEEEELKQIFEPFYSKRPGGTGLGLFLSKIMVKMWGGDIRVSSKPGAGSVFTVMCPLQKD